MDKSVVGALTILHHAAAVLAMQGFARAEHNGGNSAGCRAASMSSLSRVSAMGTKDSRQEEGNGRFSFTRSQHKHQELKIPMFAVLRPPCQTSAWPWR